MVRASVEMLFTVSLEETPIPGDHFLGIQESLQPLEQIMVLLFKMI